MSRDATRRGFATRPGDAEAWVRAPGTTNGAANRADIYTARLTIDVTPALRGRIKVAAFRRGQTVADMLRAMLEQAFPDAGSEAS